MSPEVGGLGELGRMISASLFSEMNASEPQGYFKPKPSKFSPLDISIFFRLNIKILYLISSSLYLLLRQNDIFFTKIISLCEFKLYNMSS